MVLRSLKYSATPFVKFIIGGTFVLLLIIMIFYENGNESTELEIYLTHRLSQIKQSCGEICQTRENDLVQGELIKDSIIDRKVLSTSLMSISFLKSNNHSFS